MAHPDIDPASLQLLIRLQLEEANALLASAGDGDGASADVNVALRLYVGELESLSTPQPAPVVASPVADTASSTTETQTIASRATTAQPPSESITTSRSVRRTSLFGRLLAAATTRTVVQVTEPQEANTQVAPAAASVSRTGSSIPQSRTTAESQVATTRQSTAPTQDTYVQVPAHSMPRSRTTSSTGQARTPTTDRNTVAGTTGARLPSLSTSGDANANLRRKRQRAPGPSDLSDRLQVKIKKEEEEEESLFVTDLKSTPKRPRLIKRESDSEERHGIRENGSSDLADGRTTGASGTNADRAATVPGATGIVDLVLNDSSTTPSATTAPSLQNAANWISQSDPPESF